MEAIQPGSSEFNKILETHQKIQKRWEEEQAASQSGWTLQEVMSVIRDLPKTIEFWAWVFTIGLGISAGLLLMSVLSHQASIMDHQSKLEQILLERTPRFDRIDSEISDLSKRISIEKARNDAFDKRQDASDVRQDVSKAREDISNKRHDRAEKKNAPR